MITREELIAIGHYNKPHGVAGEISATIDVDADALRELSCLVSEVDGIYVPFFINSCRSKSSETVLLTIDGHRKIDIPSRRWISKHRYVMEHPFQHQVRIKRMFTYFWSPHFANALQEYVSEKAGTNWHTPGHNSGNAFEYSPFLHGFHDAFGIVGTAAR